LFYFSGPVIKYDPKTWKDSYAALIKPVQTSADMCKWVEAPAKKPDIQVILPFTT